MKAYSTGAKEKDTEKPELKKITIVYGHLIQKTAFLPILIAPEGTITAYYYSTVQ